MPQQETFFEREISSAIQIKVLKTYDEQFAHEAFNSMDEPALAVLWLNLKVEDSYDTADISDQGPESNDFLWEVLLDEAREDGHLRSFFIVTEVKGKSSRSLYVSPDWPDAETFAMELSRTVRLKRRTSSVPISTAALLSLTDAHRVVTLPCRVSALIVVNLLAAAVLVKSNRSSSSQD
jgi:hypothetical protein